MWITKSCDYCGGSGYIEPFFDSGYGYGIECKRCSAGTVYVSDKGRLALWPGGPFVGSLPKSERSTKVLLTD